MSQRHKADAGKIRPSLLFGTLAKPLRAVLSVLMYGMQKYEANQWQNVDNAVERYTDASERHRIALDLGEEFDEESGLHHRAHLICNQLFLLWFEIRERPKTNFFAFNKPPQDHKKDVQ